MAGPSESDAILRKDLRNLRGLDSTSANRLHGTFREPRTKRLLQVTFKWREQLSAARKLSFLGLTDARCQTERKKNNGIMAYGGHDLSDARL